MRGKGKCKLLVCANKKRNPLNILSEKETVYMFLFCYPTKYIDAKTTTTTIVIYNLRRKFIIMKKKIIYRKICETCLNLLGL
jgi:hypothetical protein